MDEHITLSKVSDIKKEIEDAVPGESGELFKIPNLALSPQHERFPLVIFPGISGLFKLEAETQGFEPMCFDNKSVEDHSPNKVETVLETSNSSPSPERQNLPEGTSPRISTGTSLPIHDSREEDSIDEGIMHSTVYISDGVSQPILLVKRLTEKAIEELSAGIWRCSYCGKTEKSFLMLDLHIDTGCEELSPIECDICPAVFRAYRDFVPHFLEHQMGGTRRCPICLQECIDDMRQHLILQGHFLPNMSELDIQENVSLVVSQNPSSTGCSNSLHLESEENGLDDRKICFDSRLHSKKHRKLDEHEKMHRGIKLYKCDLCKKCFSQSISLYRHQRCHTVEKPFKCSVCGKDFFRSSHLNEHQRVHTGEKPFKCDVCKKCFSRSRDLNAHQRAHADANPFECVVCKKYFSCSSHLNQHQRQHTGEKPFKCDICQKSFSRVWSLNMHQRVHTGEKPFKCNVCKKCFSQSNDLNRHQRMHTGEKPFKCDVCKKCFSAFFNLIRHQRVHTR